MRDDEERMSATEGVTSQGGDDPAWYVMLFPSAAETRTLVAAFERLAAITGGSPSPAPHVTVGYFHGRERGEAMIERLRPLVGPAATVRAAGLFSWSEQAHPMFGWTLSLRVMRDDAVQGWQRAVRDAVQPLALTPTFTWEVQQPHMQVVRHLPEPPAVALARVADRACPLSFTARRLVVSHLVDTTIVTWLDRPLGPPSPA